MPADTPARVIAAFAVVFVLRPMRRIFTPIYAIERVRLRRLAVACGYQLTPGGRGEIQHVEHGELKSIPFIATSSAGKYGFMGQSGLPVDLNLCQNQYDMGIPEMCRMFTRMRRSARHHHLAAHDIPTAFSIAAGLRAKAEMHHDSATPTMLNFDACTQLLATHGSTISQDDLFAAAQHATDAATVNEILRLRGHVPDTLLYEMYPLIKISDRY